MIQQNPPQRTKIRLGFRGISPSLISKMKGALPDVEIQTNEGRSKEVDKYVVFLELKEAIDCEAVCKFIENNKISLENYMLRVSIVTEHEMGGILVPKFAIKLLCQLGCDLNFSFTKV